MSNIFKRIKQLLHLHQIQCKRRDSVEATLRALRVAWVLQEQQAAQLRSLLHKMVQSALSEQLDLPLARPISSWSVSKLCLQTLHHQVLGSLVYSSTSGLSARFTTISDQQTT